MKISMTFIKFLTLVFVSLSLFACAGSTRQPVVSESKNETKNEVSGLKSIRVSAPDVDAAEPAIAAAPDGGVYLVWVEHGAGRAADVYLQKFDAEAKAAGEKVRVNPQAGQATAWRGDPPTIAVAPGGEIYVGWTAGVKSEKPSGTDLYVSASSDGGKSFAAPVKVNDDAEPASHGMHSLATDKSGKIYVAWLDERNIKAPARAENKIESSSEFRYVKAHHTPTPEVKKAEEKEVEPNSEIFYSVSGDGAKTFSTNKKISGEVCPCCKTSMITTGDGKAYVSWRQVLEGDFRHIAVASTADGGENFSVPSIVSDDRWQIAACPVSGASMVLAKGGALKIAWFTAGAAGKTGIYTAESTDGGKTFAARTLINEASTATSPSFLAGESGGFGVVWEAGGKLFRSKIQANQVGKTEEFADGATPSVAISKDRLFVGFSTKEGEKRGVRLSAYDDFQP
jgi:hypothetical protein